MAAYKDNTSTLPYRPNQQQLPIHRNELDPSQPRDDTHDGPPAYNDVFPDRPRPLSLTTYNSDRKSLGQPSSESYLDAKPSMSRSTSDTSQDSVLDQALEFTHHTLPQHTPRQPLHRPVVIPQVGSGLGMPFSRGYSHELINSGVSMEEFLEFLDNYNIVSAGLPPLQILDLAGGVIGMVPIHHAQIISASIQATAKLGNAAVSKTRAAMFLKKSNTDFFNPRGLKVEIASSEAVKTKLDMDPDVPLVAPFDESEDYSVHERRMAALRGRAADVTFDVPKPNEETNVLNRMCAAQQSRTAAKNEKKTLKDRGKYVKKKEEVDEKLVKKSSELDSKTAKLERQVEKETRKRDKEIAKVQAEAEKEIRKKPKEEAKHRSKASKETDKIEREYEKEVRKIEKEMQKENKEHDKEIRKENKDVLKEDKEIKASKKILWIVVENC